MKKQLISSLNKGPLIVYDFFQNDCFLRCMLIEDILTMTHRYLRHMKTCNLKIMSILNLVETIWYQLRIKYIIWHQIYIYIYIIYYIYIHIYILYICYICKYRYTHICKYICIYIVYIHIYMYIYI